MNRLPNYIIGTRKALALTCQDLATLLGYKSGSAISRYERFHRVPSLPNALTLAAALGVPVEELFAGLYEERATLVRQRAKQLLEEQGRHKTSRLNPYRLAGLLRTVARLRNRESCSVSFKRLLD
ncbi:MAG: helix-turn-helix transcriptional regulator [Candidatus Hydrogenedentes bacterium]|nr:helix-turn-helix transcriptional regulator [Candidatus Hydrogenedentota bacterium]